ncbi:MAG: hypothetical protein ABJN69_13190 [Hellea sp.]
MMFQRFYKTLFKFGGIIVIPTTVVVAGCGAADKTSSPIPAERLTITDSQISTPQLHSDIINLVTQGDEALTQGDGAKLRQAAQSLQALGAAPISGTDDLAKNWLVSAQSISTEDGETAVPYRGRIKGPAYRKQSLAVGQQDVIEDVYYAAEAAEMTLKSLQGEELYWEIFEATSSDKPVCAGQALAKPQSCRFTPLWTAKYNIRISNISDQDTTYLFITN